MNVFDYTCIDIKEFQPNLDASPLGNYEKNALKEKIKGMHCQGCYKRGLKPYIPLLSHDFDEACMAGKIYISTYCGETITEMFEKFNLDNINTYSDLILNFLFKKEPTKDCMNLIYENLRSLSCKDYNWGLCIGENLATNYSVELIAYCKA